MPRITASILFSIVLTALLVVGGEAQAAGKRAGDALQWHAEKTGTTVVLRRTRRPAMSTTKHGVKPAAAQLAGQGKEFKQGKIKGFATTADFVKFALAPAK